MRANIRDGYNQVPHLTQDTNAKVTTSQLYFTNENQVVSPFRAVDHKASINRHAQKHHKTKTGIPLMVRKRNTGRGGGRLETGFDRAFY